MSDTNEDIEEFEVDGDADDAPLTRGRTGENLSRLKMRLAPQAAHQNPRGSKPGGTARLSRKRKQGVDSLYFDPDIIPVGMDYNWKRASVFNKPDDSHMMGLRENHWTPVPKDRHAGLMVEQGGLVLMERPAYLSEEAKQEDFDIAIARLDHAASNLTEAPPGQFERATTQTSRQNTGIGRQFANIPISE